MHVGHMYVERGLVCILSESQLKTHSNDLASDSTAALAQCDKHGTICMHSCNDVLLNDIAHHMRRAHTRPPQIFSGLQVTGSGQGNCVHEQDLPCNGSNDQCQGFKM
jgi:hypothetical protein